MSRILSHFDSLVTTINPCPDATVPVRHPCQKANDELYDDLQDYIELVNKLQKHTRCSPSNCLKTKNSQQYCRFGFPKDNVEHNFIHENDREQLELITSRNDPYVNSHNRVQLQGWRANVDLKPVLNIHAAFQYVAKYATKSELCSSFSEILNKILSESDPSGSSLLSFQRLLLHTVSERDYSVQETCYLLLGLPLYYSSRTFVILNLNNESHQWLCETGIENVMPNSDVGRTERSPVQKYWDRPVELENLSMFQLYLEYKFYNGKWKRCECENVVHIWPRPSPQRNGPQWNEFCRIKIILHVPHRSLEQLNENNSLSWSDLFNHNIANSENEFKDILGPSVDKLKDKCDDDEGHKEADESKDDARPDWMVLAEMSPNAIIDGTSDLGLRDIDRNNDWFGGIRRRYPNIDSIDLNTFVQQSRIEDDVSMVNSIIVDYQTLNEKQMIIFRKIETHYNAIITNHNQVEPLRLIIMGTAETSKSYLINAIRARLQEIAMNNGAETSPVIVLAPTGIAAFNIYGTMIYSTLSILINSSNLNIEGEQLKNLQKKLNEVNYVIIDEKSMLGRCILFVVDSRLRTVFPEHQNQPFGDRSVILVGDFGQLPPVIDEPMYSKKPRHDSLSNDGMNVYNQFREVYRLDAVCRQSGNSPEQRLFRDILMRLRDGESTIDDWRILASCNTF
ncbi:Pif1p [Rhizophagus irregularis DAOM 197198w]|uniref:ATP-dependent DNA helicase n=2 Tax=Rhizophagus irregularis TaxID=588596 RepID=A0A015LA34_RHIIW|nr:Pif1p [Rhizophagus irregularis DAOM 197198w]